MSDDDDMPHGSPPGPQQGSPLRSSNPAAVLADAPPRSMPPLRAATSAADPPQRHRLAAWVPDSLPLRTTSVPAASLRAAAEEAEAADAQSQPAGSQASKCLHDAGATMTWWCPLAAGTIEGYLCMTCIAVLPLQNDAKEMLCMAPAAWEAAALPPADVVCRALPIQRSVRPGLWWRSHQRACPLQPGLLCRPLQPHIRCVSASSVGARCQIQ